MPSRQSRPLSHCTANQRISCVSVRIRIFACAVHAPGHDESGVFHFDRARPPRSHGCIGCCRCTAAAEAAAGIVSWAWCGASVGVELTIRLYGTKTRSRTDTCRQAL